MDMSYDALRQEALEALLAGDARKAYSSFRWVLEYPGAQELRASPPGGASTGHPPGGGCMCAFC